MVRFIVFIYLRFVTLTSKIHLYSDHSESLELFNECKPIIFAFWHRHLPFFIYYFGSIGAWVMTNPKGKNDIFTSIAHFFGTQTAIGSFEGGGRHALIILIEKLKEGKQVALAADSARSEQETCRAGPFIIAQESSHPIIPTKWNSKNPITLRYQGKIVHFPKPFSTIQIQLGEPIRMSKNAGFDEIEAAKQILSSRLNG